MKCMDITALRAEKVEFDTDANQYLRLDPGAGHEPQWLRSSSEVEGFYGFTLIYETVEHDKLETLYLSRKVQLQ